MLELLFSSNRNFLNKLRIYNSENNSFRDDVQARLVSIQGIDQPSQTSQAKSTPSTSVETSDSHKNFTEFSFNLMKNNKLYLVIFSEKNNFILAYEDLNKGENIAIDQDPLESIMYLDHGNLKSKYSCPLIRQDFKNEKREFTFRGIGLIEKIISQDNLKIYQANFGTWKPLSDSAKTISEDLFASEISENKRLFLKTSG